MVSYILHVIENFDIIANELIRAHMPQLAPIEDITKHCE